MRKKDCEIFLLTVSLVLLPICSVMFPQNVLAFDHGSGGHVILSSVTESNDTKNWTAINTDKKADSGENFFRAGTWNLQGYASAATGRSRRHVYAVHVGAGHHLIDNVSINFEGVLYHIDQQRDTGAGGMDMLLRWHYFNTNHWSLYIDGGAGGIYSKKPLRTPGTHFNFTLQGGLGAVYALSEKIHPMAGMRWFHISNARIRGKNRNVGYDSPMFYLGVMILFVPHRGYPASGRNVRWQQPMQ